MKIALFFGTFNPIHIGHLIIGQAALQQAGVDKVWFVVSPSSPDKDYSKLLHEFDRFDLVREATRDNPDFKAIDIEFQLPKPSYTYLTIRKLKEENCRMELGQLILYLNKIEDQINHEKSEINKYFEIQEGALKNGALGGQINAFPMLVKAKDQNIILLERDKKKQEELIADKKMELAQLRGDLKVMENLKEKDYQDYRKALNKEIDQKVEEQTQNWLQFKDKKV
jgi:cytidyltransferase-like protein